MPLVRYEIRNEYSLARPNLYRSADKDDPDALLEGVAMAGIVGIVRQLGDLAEFAAEIFHDLHEQIMATAARGHELMIRVQQLEAEVPLVEKAVSERNQLCLAHRIGGDWHASIRNDQNHLTHSDLPRFIRNSYEECRGPPRLFILDKFDVAGAGACLKRYTDPSFFKTEWASSKLRKAENAQIERNTTRLKKRIRRQRNGEITGVAVASQNNSRFYYSTLDLAGQMVVPGNLYCTSSHLLALEQQKKVPSAGLVHEDQTKNDLVIGQFKEFQSLKISGKDIEVTKMCSDTVEMQKEFVFVNGERKPLVEDDLGPINEVGSEAENFVDALTIIESELEIDSECQIKREVDSDINCEHRKAGSQVDTKLHELLAECSIFPDVESCYSNKYAGDVADIKSSTPSEDSGSQSLSLPSLNASLQSGEKLQTAGLDCGNRDTMTADCVSSGSGNIVWTTTTPNVETEDGDNNVMPLASTADAMPTTSTNFVQIPDAFLDRSSSFAFSNSELPSSVCHVHAFEDHREKESTADPDSANDCNMLVNSLSSVHSNIVQMTDSSAEAPLDDDPDIKSFAIIACDVAVTTFVQNHDAVLDRSSSFAFSNFESSNVPLNTTAAACFDNADALFKFVTPELSIMYSDPKFASTTLVEEPLTISKSSAGVTDIEKVGNSQPSFISEDSKRSESVSVSDAFEHKPGKETESSLVPQIPSDASKTEVAACIDVPELGCDDVHVEHPCSELEGSYAENEIQGDHVSGEKTFSEHESSSTTLPVCISVQSGIEERHMESSIGILHGKHSTELCGELLASINAEVVEPSIDCESLGNQGLEFSSCKDTFQLKPVQICEKSSDPLVTATNLNKVEFSPELQSFEVPNNGASAPLLATREFSSDMLGNKLISGIDNSKVYGAVFENDLNPDTLPKDIPVDLIHPESSSVGHIDTLGSALSSNNYNGKSLNEHTKNETEAFVIPDSPGVNNCAMSPVAFFDSRSLSESTDVRSHNFISPEANVGPLAEFHIEKVHAMAGASPADPIYVLEHFHAELVTKDSNAEFEGHHVGEPHGFYAKKGPPSSLSHGNAKGHGLSSSSQDHSYVSDSQLATISDYYPEIMSPPKHPSFCKTTDIAPSCLLPEPAILVEKELEEKSIVDCVSFSSNNIKQSSERVIDETQALNLSHTVDGSKCGHQRDHVEHSSVSCSDHSMEVNAGFAVLPEISMSTNEELGSSRVLLSSSLATNSSSLSTPRDSLLPKLDNDKVLEGHNRNFIQPYSRSCTSNGLSLSVSMSNNSYDVQVVSASQSKGLGSEDLVSSSLITEPKIQACVSQETPPPPPLPPLNWWLTRSHKISLPSTKAEAAPAFPAPPAPPPPPPLKHSGPAQRSQSQKTFSERNDSLIKAIASHDKSTLRKVIQQSQSLKARPLNEREELLEQIRTRSFSLRQTAVKKHEIPSPATNINVSAILEKACAIRQAFVGSEDDEDDDWSDD